MGSLQCVDEQGDALPQYNGLADGSTVSVYSGEVLLTTSMVVAGGLYGFVLEGRNPPDVLWVEIDLPPHLTPADEAGACFAYDTMQGGGLPTVAFVYPGTGPG